MKKLINRLGLMVVLMAITFFATAQEKPNSYWVTADNGEQMEVFQNTPQNPNGSRAAGSLTTLFASDNGFAGNMFDVIVTNTINISSFDVNVESGTGSISVYYKLNTYVGSEITPGDWTLAGTVSGIVSNGLDIPTPVAIGGIELTAGNTYGFYVTVSDYPNLFMRYTNGGPTDYSDANITIRTGVGNAFPIFGGTFNPRAWNGTIHYTATPPVPLANWPIYAGILLIGAFIIISYRRKLAIG